MRLFRNRAVVTIVTLSLICASTTTAEAGVVPWLWNVFFGPANAPMFPRLAANRQAQMNAAYCPPGNGFAAGNGFGGFAAQPVALSAPAYSASYAPTYAASYAPPAYSYAAPSYAAPSYATPSYSYASDFTYSDPVISNSYLASSYSTTPFEYSSYVAGCGCCGTSAYPIGGNIISDVVIDGGTTIESGTSNATGEDDNDKVYEPPMGGSSTINSPRPNAGDGMDNNSGSDGGFGGVGDDGFRDPIERTPGSRRDGLGGTPPADGVGGGFGGFGGGAGGDDPDLFKVNKPVSEDPDTSEAPAPPSGKAPATPPEARRSMPEVITTVSLTGKLGRDGQLNRTGMSFASIKNKKTRPVLRWISVPNNGRTVLR